MRPYPRMTGGARKNAGSVVDLLYKIGEPVHCRRFHAREMPERRSPGIALAFFSTLSGLQGAKAMRTTAVVFACALASALMSSAANAVPTDIYYDFWSNPEYPGNTVGGFTPAPSPSAWALSGEMRHTIDASSGRYNIAHEVLTLISGDTRTNLTPAVNSVDILVSGNEFVSGSYVLASSVPDLGLDTTAVLLVGALKAATIGMSVGELGGHMRFVGLFEWTYVSPLLGDLGRYWILESHSGVDAFGGPFTFEGVFGHDWTDSAPLHSYFYRVLPVDEPRSLLLIAAGLLGLGAVRLGRRRIRYG